MLPQNWSVLEPVVLTTFVWYNSFLDLKHAWVFCYKMVVWWWSTWRECGQSTEMYCIHVHVLLINALSVHIPSHSYCWFHGFIYHHSLLNTGANISQLLSVLASWSVYLLFFSVHFYFLHSNQINCFFILIQMLKILNVKATWASLSDGYERFMKPLFYYCYLLTLHRAEMIHLHQYWLALTFLLWQPCKEECKANFMCTLILKVTSVLLYCC